MRRTAVITGAASGLGAALARLLAAEGWGLALVDLPPSAAALETLVAGSRAGGAREGGSAAIIAPFDVRDARGWQMLHDRARSAWPSIDLLVNAAGVGATGEVGRLPEGQWRRVIDTNLVGTALGCETFLPWLRENPGGARVVNVASISGLLGIPSMAAYSASKAAVIALSEAIAAESPAGKPGVTIVCPGFFRSGLLDTWHFTADREAREARRRMAATSLDSAALANRIRRAIDRDERYVIEGLQARWLWRLKRLAPRTTTALLRRVYRRLG
ncbi:MAG: SDR family NAD(P)-dependent oxidoreductase [Planctomycetia bacterium]